MKAYVIYVIWIAIATVVVFSLMDLFKQTKKKD
jgi:tryptophan-rich sensory protein